MRGIIGESPFPSATYAGNLPFSNLNSSLRFFVTLSPTLFLRLVPDQEGSSIRCVSHKLRQWQARIQLQKTLPRNRQRVAANPIYQLSSR
jgi:hypothetical protein